MPQYCDSNKLEQNWFYWLLSSRVSSLEKYRKLGLLWTKVLGAVTDDEGTPISRHGKTLSNPSYPIRAHCLALAMPIYFNSYDGSLQPTGTIFKGHKASQTDLPSDDDLTLLSSSPVHQLNRPLLQLTCVIPQLMTKGYIKEIPNEQTWHAMLEDIVRMCQGIATKFKQKTEDDHFDLASEALLHVTNKLSTYKLVYTPGRAPVFNLLTTTIHRIMFSIMNRRKHQREGLHRVLAEAEAGILPTTNRSLRVQTSHRSIKTR